MIYRKGRDYIIVGLQAYDGPIGSNCVNIARELAKHNRVLYVNYPWDINSYLKQLLKPEENSAVRRQVLRGKQDQLHKESENLWVLYPKLIINSINWIPDGRLYDSINLRNNQAIAAKIRSAIHRLGFENFVLFNDSDMFRSFYLDELLKPEAFIYYSRDNLITQAYFLKHGKRLEGILIRKADVAVANSPYLRDYCKQFNENSYYVGQGCETDIFDPEAEYERPDDIPDTDKPVVGYIGALLNMRLDIQLLIELAESRPEYNFILVGPEDEFFKTSRLHQMDNVIFTGPKKPGELPRYLHFFDVAINPQLTNELTIGNYPRKVDEYLAMGKPVVATHTRAMEIFRNYTYLAEDLNSYQKAIDQALSEDDQDKKKARINFARTHTWENSLDQIYTPLEKVMAKKNQAARS